jgi:N-acetylglutamate synthase-like GNAT family acetyltransferase
MNIERWIGDKGIIKTFYDKYEYNYEAQENEEILVAKNDDVIGVVRLCVENETLVLRGMQIADDFRGKGIGTKLLEGLSTIIGDRECYCIPYSHLEDFYSKIDFVNISEDQAPEFLRNRISGYRNKNKHKEYILMKKFALK